MVETVQRLALTPLKICVHLIDGLPGEDEEMMLEQIHIRYFDLMDQFHERIINRKLILSEEEVEELENCVNEFVYEYGFIQFKRGVHLAVAIIHG